MSRYLGCNRILRIDLSLSIMLSQLLVIIFMPTTLLQRLLQNLTLMHLIILRHRHLKMINYCSSVSLFGVLMTNGDKLKDCAHYFQGIFDLEGALNKWTYHIIIFVLIRLKLCFVYVYVLLKHFYMWHGLSYVPIDYILSVLIIYYMLHCDLTSLL